MSSKTQAPVNTTTKPSLNADKSGLLQRKCACGNSAGLTNECNDCQSKKLTMQPHATNETEPEEVAPIVHEILNSPSHPLEPETLAFMESRFHHDFSQVQVHTA
ncbi:hypothetical protein [Nostoc sp.]|uniref:hypothetical protein n=1 Tax=Nostoc sp. TaxID=1180 RepID=UPI002FF4864E